MRIRPENRRIAILLSGRGSNFTAIADRVEGGALAAEIALVLSNRESAPGLAEARRRGLETAVVPSAGRPREDFDREVADRLRERDVGLICLAGFMRVFSAEFIAAHRHRILNIHPSLLPAFPGLEAPRQALEHGVRFSGCTVHFVDEALDGGPILMQAVVPVRSADTAESLAARILAEEHRLYPEAIGAVLAGRCELEGRRVAVHDS